MPRDIYFGHEEFDTYFWKLAKKYRSLSKNRIEILVIGGSAVLLYYSFRLFSNDIDVVFLPFSDALKQAIYEVAEENDLSREWLNDNFKYTNSYTRKLIEKSIFYKSFNHLIDVRIVHPLDLICMKLVFARPYKNDLSDVVGILSEERNKGNNFRKEDILKNIEYLYGKDKLNELSDNSKKLLSSIFDLNISLENLFVTIKEHEKSNKVILIENNPNMEKKATDQEIIDLIKKIHVQ